MPEHATDRSRALRRLLLLRRLFPLRRGARRLLTAAAALLAGSALLSGCASPPDPTVARESLENVTEDPSQPEAAEEYDAELHPEPIVEPVDCSPYLVITVRGTGEPHKGQLLSPVARKISKARPDQVEILDLDYPADTDIKEGGTEGVRMLIDTLNVQAEACEEQRFVLLGYSQGALIIGDALSSADARIIGATVGAVGEEAAERVLAIVFYGDPRFVGSEPFNAGDFDPALGGLLPRPEAALAPFADRISDYCVARDFICQSNLDLQQGVELDEEGHVEYFDNGMQDEGAEFAIARLDPPVPDRGGRDDPDADATAD
ncbi:cutinase family protein [Leucobacter ruminantium]|uniref:Cutinase family protein n=1 Tax=Leucobacter ruminantium TaxID=1289170 RepID=A0A939RYR0_9MICO|nr:cutinase family protein [Leucobacter ruminantium]MBO1804714.1 cutinase family protein [Leucobacter ruminantium]